MTALLLALALAPAAPVPAAAAARPPDPLAPGDLGLTLVDLADGFLAREAMVVAVRPSGPAVGVFEPGDVVTAVGPTAVAGRGAARAADLAAQYRPGAVVLVRFERDVWPLGRVRLAAPVRLAPRPEGAEVVAPGVAI